MAKRRNLSYQDIESALMAFKTGQARGIMDIDKELEELWDDPLLRSKKIIIFVIIN